MMRFDLSEQYRPEGYTHRVREQQPDDFRPAPADYAPDVEPAEEDTSLAEKIMAILAEPGANDAAKLADIHQLVQPLAAQAAQVEESRQRRARNQKSPPRGGKLLSAWLSHEGPAPAVTPRQRRVAELQEERRRLLTRQRAALYEARPPADPKDLARWLSQ